jgi:sulfur-oxidizing protein SoxB
MRFEGQLMEANKIYKVAGWAPVQETSKNAGPPIWDIVETYLKDKKTIGSVKLYNPKLLGLDGNPGAVI